MSATDAICDLCLLSILPSPEDPSTLEVKQSSNCPTHSSSTYCLNCFRHWVDIELDRFPPRPRCPGTGCSSFLTYDEIRELATPANFSRYDEYVLRELLLSLPAMQACKARDGDGTECRNVQEHVGGDDAPIMTCRECGRKTCVVCQMEMHDGVTCSQFKAGQGPDESDDKSTDVDGSDESDDKSNDGSDDGSDIEPIDEAELERQKKEEEEAARKLEIEREREREREMERERERRERERLAEEARLEERRKEVGLSEDWLSENAKQCPKCASWIQKTDGCDHMTCYKGCGMEFCWLCRAPFDQIRAHGNQYHERSCKHYA